MGNERRRLQCPGSTEEIVVDMNRGAVVERDALVVAVEPGVDLPLIGGADLREGRAARGGAEADKLQGVADASAVAGEVVEDVAAGLAGAEDEEVVAAQTIERVGTAAADAIIAGIALDEVGDGVAEAVDVSDALQIEELEVVADLIAD